MSRCAMVVCLVAGFLAAVAAAAGQEQRFTERPANGLALLPPMGWNSWNKFGCNIDEDVIQRQADAMVSSGMAAAGYTYLIVDDCWQGERDGEGRIQADPVRFPSGIRALADYVHARGLKFGIYSDAGDKTCQKRPGSRGHEYQDAIQYATWGADYLKYDWCNSDSLEPRATYETMADALRATGRPIVYSICEWGAHRPWLWAAQLGGNLWRTSGDIYDAWAGVAHDNDWHGVLDILDQQVDLAAYAGPGHWNDPDMLEVGNGGMTGDQYRAHFSLWAILAAPLIAGNDLTVMTSETARILTNREVIAVDQDALGAQGNRVWQSGDAEVWVKLLSGGGRAVAVLNRGSARRSVRIDWGMLRWPENQRVRVRDLWESRMLPQARGSLVVDVAGTAVRMLRMDPQQGGP